VGQIQEASPRLWRMQMRRAEFRGARFHVESEHYASGRRIAMHIYPKRDDPYAEDMGRTPRSYDITGYVIENDKGLGPAGFNAIDYRRARDRLIDALEQEAPGQLVIPTQRIQGLVRCMGYSRTESRDRGGYCLFEMKFIEYGRPGNDQVAQNTQDTANQSASNLNNTAAQNFNNSASVRFVGPGGQPTV
jgi:prophage DNA circulation protein